MKTQIIGLTARRLKARASPVSLSSTFKCFSPKPVNHYFLCLANEFQKSSGRYKEMPTETVKELEEKLNALEKPTNYYIKQKTDQSKKKARKEKKEQAITEGQAKLEDVDIGTDSEEEGGISEKFPIPTIYNVQFRIAVARCDFLTCQVLEIKRMYYK